MISEEFVMAIFCLLLLIVGPPLLIQQVGRWPDNRRLRLEERGKPSKRGFSVVTDPDASLGPTPARPMETTFWPDAGPGRYRIVGVVQETHEDTTVYIEAQSLANAKVKAELRGVVVTAIDKVE